MQAARFWKYVVVVAAIGVMAGCSDDDNNGNNEGRTIPEEDELTLTDAQIARVLEVANEGEVMLSQLALERGTADV
jgi:putative membrane protein